VSTAEWHRRSAEQFVDRVRGVRDDQWTAPTPCSDWDVRTLVNHIVYENRWTVPLMRGGTIAEVGDKFEGDLLGGAPVKAAAEAGREAIDATSAPGTLEKIVHLSFGDVPGEEYAMQLFADHLIHGWDLAAAIGGDRALDPELVEACAGWFAEREEMYRNGGAVAARVPLPGDAGAAEKLLAAFGRDPAWSAPS
jgi:uncharacterized protein (TIGR03086 family)